MSRHKEDNQIHIKHMFNVDEAFTHKHNIRTDTKGRRATLILRHLKVIFKYNCTFRMETGCFYYLKLLFSIWRENFSWMPV